jgi:hypothetical protein
MSSFGNYTLDCLTSVIFNTLTTCLDSLCWKLVGATSPFFRLGQEGLFSFFFFFFFSFPSFSLCPLFLGRRHLPEYVTTTTTLSTN